MRTKKIITGILTGALCLSMLTACSGSNTTEDDASAKAEENSQSESSITKEESQAEESSKEESQTESGDKEDDKLHTIYILDAGKNDKMTAHFFNTMNDETAEVAMTKTAEGDDYYTYSCDADTSLYNMVNLTYGDDIVSKDVAFNSYVAGWYLKDEKLLPYAEGMDLKYDPPFDTTSFTFDGYEKTVYIWTPSDYDETSDEQYSTIYMLDGQTVLATGMERGMDSDTDSWNVSESVTGMMSVTDNKAIIVCIVTGDQNRDNELIPDIGELNNRGPEPIKSEKRGNDFADFICDTIMPYVQENYNVYTDAAHTSLAGSSLGGLETFYAVLSHPDKFGTGGEISNGTERITEDFSKNPYLIMIQVI